jgi:hypothetical protein
LYGLTHLLNQQAEKGIPTISGKSKSESKDKEKKHKKHKDKDREKDKEHKKHKHRQKDRSKDKNKDKDKKKDKSGYHDSGGDHLKKHHEKVCLFFLFLMFISSVSLSCIHHAKPCFLWFAIFMIYFRRGSMMEWRSQWMCIRTRKARYIKSFFPFCNNNFLIEKFPSLTWCTNIWQHKSSKLDEIGNGLLR